MANTRTKSGESGEILTPGDQDSDFEGTFPGSSRLPAESQVSDPRTIPYGTARPSRVRPTRTTKDQWRKETHAPADVQECPPLTDAEKEAARPIARLVVELAWSKKTKDQPPGPKPGTPIGPNGRAMLGSRALPSPTSEQLIADNPGDPVAE
jgi:hypothetical protein